MSYKPMGMMRATAGLGMGPSGISPPFRRYGFRSFDGLGALGFDRLAENRTRTFVFSISAVRGLPSGGASLVPRRIREYMLSRGLTNADVGWSSGGRVWGRYTLALSSSLLRDSTSRRAKLQQALEQAARSIGSSVSFEVSGLGRVPSSAPPKAARSGGGVVVIPTVDIEGQIPTTLVSVSELQALVKSKGFNPGSLDGKWGGNTSGALNQAARAAGVPLQEGAAVGSADKRSVTLPTAVWTAVRGLPARQPPSEPAPSAPAHNVTDMVPAGDGGALTWLPWAIGGAAMLGIGGYFVYRGRGRRAVAANRRRRRRSSKRRSSRRGH